MTWNSAKVALIVLISFGLALSVQAGHPSVYTLDCPDQYGTIIKRINNKSEKTVLVIQDAHTDLAVQKNIARLIAYYTSSQPLQLIAVEGAQGYMDYETYRDYPVQSIRDRLAEKYVGLGIFTGAEYAAITADSTIDLFGAEDWQTFEKNYRARYRISGRMPAQIETIRAMLRQLETLKVPLYKDELFLFDKQAADFESARLSLESFLPIVYTHMKKKGLSFLEFPQVATVSGLARSQMFLDRLQAEREEARLMGALSEHIDISKLKAAGELERARFIINACKENHVPIDAFEAFLKLYAYNRAMAAVDAVVLLQELNQICHTLRMSYASTQAAHELIHTERILTCALSVAELKATREEVRFFCENRDAFDLERIDSFIKTEARKHGQSMRGDYDLSESAEFFNTAEDFYRGVLARDSMIARNLIDTMEAKKETAAVLVIGGFHTEGIVHELSQKRINAIIVSPRHQDHGPSIDIHRRFFGPLKDIQPEMVGTIQPLRSFVESYSERVKKKFADEAFDMTLEMIQ